MYVISNIISLFYSIIYTFMGGGCCLNAADPDDVEARDGCLTSGLMAGAIRSGGMAGMIPVIIVAGNIGSGSSGGW